ncbi:MAG: hypothetical protein WCA49_19620 [Candidatus Sulfotelmatobacter sp.]
MSPAAADAPQNAPALAKTATRSPLGQLLHALNQPLTGLQCSMEVALASPRTAGQYAQGLREGLELTGRMRALVEAMREVADIAEEKTVNQETAELASLLREAVEDLGPVAEVKKVRIALDFSSSCSCASSFAVRAARAPMASAIFRLVDSAVSMAAPGTAVRIEAGSESNAVWLRLRWQAGMPRSALSRPELGLLIAQARMERSGAEWGRAETQAEGMETETLTVRLPCAAPGVL